METLFNFVASAIHSLLFSGKTNGNYSVSLLLLDVEHLRTASKSARASALISCIATSGLSIYSTEALGLSASTTSKTSTESKSQLMTSIIPMFQKLWCYPVP